MLDQSMTRSYNILRPYDISRTGKPASRLYRFPVPHREQRNRKYYLYGAGQQREISHFAQYELLEEIICRPAPDMPVFFVQKGEELHELAGYYIFYQSNEAMQNYMVEQRRTEEAGDRMRNRETVQAGGRLSGSRNIIRPPHIIRPHCFPSSSASAASLFSGSSCMAA
mgnify:CR=1 FL=1